MSSTHLPASPSAGPPFPGAIAIVSGLPRSGTSVMMQMLVAGGIPALTDGKRVADEDNPRGYYEFERAKAIKTDAAWLSDARGKVVKMVHLLLLDLPDDPARRYDIVFMRRDLTEVVASQARMLARSGKAGGNITPGRLMDTYARQVDRVLSHLSSRPNVRVLEVSYNTLVQDTAATVAKVAAFLGAEGRTMDAGAMAAAVDPKLYRNRS